MIHKMAKKDKNKPDNVVVSSNEGSNLKGKKSLVLVLALVLLILIVGGGWALYKTNKRAVVVCKSGQGGIVTEAATVLQQKDRDKLQPIVEKIKNQPKYDKDVNCLYILATYDLNTGNLAESRQYVDLINKQKNPQITAELVKTGGDLKSLNERLQTLEKQLEESRKNIRGVEYIKTEGEQ